MQMYSLDAGEAMVVEIGDEIALSFRPGAGATITYSRVSERDASAHGTTQIAVTAYTSIVPNWPYYYISVAGGTAEVAAL